MTKTYTSRPPASARAARRAWDYFATKYRANGVVSLSYSQKCDGYPGWVCEIGKPENWSMHWGTGYSCDWWLKSELASNIEYLSRR